MLVSLPVLLIAGYAAGLPADAPNLPADGEARFPRSVAGWELASPAAAWSVDQQSRTRSIDLTYQRNGRDMHVVVVETLSLAAKLPESRLAPRDRKLWREKHVRSEAACAASGCISLLHSTWQRGKGMQLRHLYSAYSIGNSTTDSRLALRALHGWSRLTGGRDTPRLTVFIADDPIPDIAEFAARFPTFQFGERLASGG